MRALWLKISVYFFDTRQISYPNIFFLLILLPGIAETSAWAFPRGVTASFYFSNHRCYGSERTEAQALRKLTNRIYQLSPAELVPQLFEISFIEAFTLTHSSSGRILYGPDSGTSTARISTCLESGTRARIFDLDAIIAHEIGHSLFDTALRSHQFLDETDDDRYIAPLDELFADLFAAYILNDPKAISRDLNDPTRSFSIAGQYDPNKYNYTIFNSQRPRLWTYFKCLSGKSSGTAAIASIANMFIDFSQHFDKSVQDFQRPFHRAFRDRLRQEMAACLFTAKNNLAADRPPFLRPKPQWFDGWF